jgi:hypothetical protein
MGILVVMGLSHIDIYVPRKLDYGIIFLDCAAMKAWKRLKT